MHLGKHPAFTQRYRSNKPCANWRPCWTTFHALGVTVSQELPVDHTYTDIAKRFGISKQNAYHECMIALGKVVFELRKLRDRNR